MRSGGSRRTRARRGSGDCPHRFCLRAPAIPVRHAPSRRLQSARRRLFADLWVDRAHRLRLWRTCSHWRICLPDRHHAGASVRHPAPAGRNCDGRRDGALRGDRTWRRRWPHHRCPTPARTRPAGADRYDRRYDGGVGISADRPGQRHALDAARPKRADGAGALRKLRHDSHACGPYRDGDVARRGAGTSPPVTTHPVWPCVACLFGRSANRRSLRCRPTARSSREPSCFPQRWPDSRAS